jgi:hypothetical protein
VFDVASGLNGFCCGPNAVTCRPSTPRLKWICRRCIAAYAFSACWVGEASTQPTYLGATIIPCRIDRLSSELLRFFCLSGRRSVYTAINFNKVHIVNGIQYNIHSIVYLLCLFELMSLGFIARVSIGSAISWIITGDSSCSTCRPSLIHVCWILFGAWLLGRSNYDCI